MDIQDFNGSQIEPFQKSTSDIQTQNQEIVHQNFSDLQIDKEKRQLEVSTLQHGSIKMMNLLHIH